MNQGVLQVSSFTKNEDVSVVEPWFNLPDPFEIPYYGRELVPSNNHMSHVVICMPTLSHTRIACMCLGNTKSLLWTRSMKK